MNLEPIALRVPAHRFAAVCAVSVSEVHRAGATRGAGSLSIPAGTIVAVVTGLAVGVQIRRGGYYCE